MTAFTSALRSSMCMCPWLINLHLYRSFHGIGQGSLVTRGEILHKQGAAIDDFSKMNIL